MSSFSPGRERGRELPPKLKCVEALPDEAGHEPAFPLSPEHMSEALRRRDACRSYALSLVSAADKTCAQLERKLLERYSPEETEDALAFMRQYGYLDDERYARRFAEFFRGKRSRREVEQKLYEKGIPSAVSAACLGELDEDYDLEGACVQLEKRLRGRRLLSRPELLKAQAALQRKGYGWHAVRLAVQRLGIQTEYDSDTDIMDTDNLDVGF